MLQKQFHTALAGTFVQDIQYLINNYYYFLGRTYPWGTVDTPNAATVFTDAQQNLIRSDSLFYKKIQPSDISLVVARYDWVSGTVYDMWDNTIDMVDKQFYVVIFDSIYSRYNVYKCLDNNGGSNSTVSPSGVSPYAQSYSDGYIWKFMYSITETMMDVFGTTTKMPIQTAMTSHFYNKGTVSTISIIDGGSEYSNDVIIYIEGDGDGAVANAVVQNGVIVEIQMISQGQGYTYARVTTTNTAGTTAILKAVIATSAYNTEQAVVEQLATSGSIHAIKTVSGGTFYSSGTTISIIGDGIGATANATIVNGTIQKINITNIGSGYTYANIIVTDPLEAERPSGASNYSGYAIMAPQGGHGKNAVRELYASEVNISTQIPIMEFQSSNDFRQVGIIKNPVYESSGKYVRQTSELCLYKVVFNTVENLVVDSVLTSNSNNDQTSTYRVIYFDTNTREVYLLPMTKNSKTPSALIGVQSYSVQSISSYPTIDKYSGDLLYVSNHTPFATVIDQTITLKTNIKF